MDSSNNNIETFNNAAPTTTTNNFFYILIFYIIVSVLGLGTLLNLLYMSKWGQRIRIKYIKQSAVINLIAYLLIYLSILGFPTIAIYIFTQLYYYKSSKIF